MTERIYARYLIKETLSRLESGASDASCTMFRSIIDVIVEDEDTSDLDRACAMMLRIYLDEPEFAVPETLLAIRESLRVDERGQAIIAQVVTSRWAR